MTDAGQVPVPLLFLDDVVADIAWNTGGSNCGFSGLDMWRDFLFLGGSAVSLTGDVVRPCSITTDVDFADGAMQLTMNGGSLLHLFMVRKTG